MRWVVLLLLQGCAYNLADVFERPLTDQEREVVQCVFRGKHRMMYEFRYHHVPNAYWVQSGFDPLWNGVYHTEFPDQRSIYVRDYDQQGSTYRRQQYWHAFAHEVNHHFQNVTLGDSDGKHLNQPTWDNAASCEGLWEVPNAY